MIYTANTKKAILLAYRAHENQVDKAGLPYILHPVHLAEQMDTEEECMVALLHDVVEDTDITFEELEKEFPKTVIDALKLLTHDKETDYMEYIQKIKTNPIATKVKLADLKHNSDTSRLDEETIKKLNPEKRKKYEEAIQFLSK